VVSVSFCTKHRAVSHKLFQSPRWNRLALEMICLTQPRRVHATWSWRFLFFLFFHVKKMRTGKRIKRAAIIAASCITFITFMYSSFRLLGLGDGPAYRSVYSILRKRCQSLDLVWANFVWGPACAFDCACAIYTRKRVCARDRVTEWQTKRLGKTLSQSLRLSFCGVASLSRDGQRLGKRVTEEKPKVSVMKNREAMLIIWCTGGRGTETRSEFHEYWCEVVRRRKFLFLHVFVYERERERQRERQRVWKAGGKEEEIWQV
jgi:hypothetical protein